MIDDLLARLERDADEEIARLLAHARATAAEITAQAEARSEERRRLARERGVAEGQAVKARALARAQASARATVLQARAALLERFFERLRAVLPGSTDTPAYRAALAADLSRSRAFVGDQPVIVRCAPTLAPLLRRTIKTSGRVHIHPDARIGTGFCVATADDALEIDETLEGRMERLRPRLALEALAMLRAP